MDKQKKKSKTTEQLLNKVEEERDRLLKQLEKERNKGMKYCIIRTYSAGVFAGYVLSRKGKEVILKNARRIWYWEGAASLSELAMKGTAKPDKCKFPIAVNQVELTEVIEIIPTTKRAKKSIKDVPEWKQNE